MFQTRIPFLIAAFAALHFPLARPAAAQEPPPGFVMPNFVTIPMAPPPNAGGAMAPFPVAPNTRRLDHLTDFGGRLYVPSVYLPEPIKPIEHHEVGDTRSLIRNFAPDNFVRQQVLERYPDIGGAAWFDYHRDAAAGYLAAIEAAGGEGADFDFEPMEERSYLSQAFVVLAVQVATGWPDPFSKDDMGALFAVRALKPYGGAVTPPASLRLTHSYRDVPEGAPLALPLDRAATEPWRRVSFLAELSEGSEIPGAIRFQIEADAPIRVIDPQAGCDGGEVVICDLPGAPKSEVVVELLGPEVLPLDRPSVTLSPEIRVTAQAARGGGLWSPPETDGWSQDFRMCDLALRDAVGQLPWAGGRSSGFRDELRRATAPLEGVARARLYPGPIHPAIADPARDTTQIEKDPQSLLLGTEITAIAERGGLDDYLIGRSLLPLLARAEAFVGLDRCDTDAAEPIYAAFEAELEKIAAALARYRDMRQDTEAAAQSWQRKAEMDWATLYEPLAKSGRVETDVGNQIYDFFYGIEFERNLVGHFGKTAGSILNAPHALISAVDTLIAVGEELALLDDLLAFRRTLAEATAWYEAQVYAELMVARYELAQTEVETALAQMRLAKDGACTCFDPGR